jgi:hypothetical protein
MIPNYVATRNTLNRQQTHIVASLPFKSSSKCKLFAGRLAVKNDNNIVIIGNLVIDGHNPLLADRLFRNNSTLQGGVHIERWEAKISLG